MPVDKITLENPPECNIKLCSDGNTRLASLLVANIESAKRNDEMRKKLECKTDGTEFKLKASKEITSHVKQYFNQDIDESDSNFSIVKVRKESLFC